MFTIEFDNTQREFFRNAATAAFANPFSPERDALDASLAGGDVGTLARDELDRRVAEALGERFDELVGDGAFDLRRCEAPDREMFELAWLYYQFHLFQDAFDAFILAQERAGDTPIELPFAEQLLEHFTKAGFTQVQADQYIALFYQLRRGFYFISRGASGACPSMVNLRMRLWTNIFTFHPRWYLDYLCGRMDDFSTLLLGETGVGKSLSAYAIGCSGNIPFDRKQRCFKESFTRSFQTVNLSQFPANLLESELFGHKKGAFTGAVENHAGLFERCSGHGAVFIDEIGDVDLPTQVKLLTVLQERVFSPVGSHQRQRFEGRVIAATNQDISALRARGEFRDDLYYRLCSDVITIPSLRQRIREDQRELRMLVAALLRRMLNNDESGFVDQVVARVCDCVPNDYAWPGNVRELEQAVRRVCLTGDYTPEVVEDHSTVNIGQAAKTAQQVLQEYCHGLYTLHGNYATIARITELDRRTVKKYIQLAESQVEE